MGIPRDTDLSGFEGMNEEGGISVGLVLYSLSSITGRTYVGRDALRDRPVCDSSVEFGNPTEHHVA